jgi:hypothetical protein
VPAGHCDGNRPTLGRIEPDQVSDDSSASVKQRES